MPENTVLYPDLPDFSSMSPKDRNFWFNEHYATYLNIVGERLYSLLSSPDRAVVPCGRNVFSSTVMEYIDSLHTHSQLVYPILALLSYAGANLQGYTCHNIVFSEHRPVNVYGRTEYFLELFSAASPATQNAILANLKQSAEPNRNPLSILKSRFTEIAFSLGMSVSEYMRQRFSYSVTNYAVCGKFLNATFDAEPNFSTRFEIGQNNSLFRAVSFIALVEGYSVDYLLLQDYSHIATLHGEPLNETLTEALSLYLCASSAARLDAFRSLLYPIAFA